MVLGKALDAVLGNAGQIESSQIKEEITKCFLEDEQVTGAYQTIRDQIVFTNKRFIYLDIQGLSGKKQSLLSVPYRSVTSYAMQSAGSLDSNVEFFISCKQMEYPITLKFKKGTDLQPLYNLISQMVLNV